MSGKAARPTVAQILYSGLGGHGGVVFSMIDADRDRTWNSALAFQGVEPWLPAYRERCAVEGVAAEYLQAIPRRPWRGYLPLLRWLGRVRPDAIILHTPTALPGVWLHARRYGVPVIVVEHQPNDLKTRQDWLFSRLSMRVAEAVVTLTPRHRAELAARLGSAFRPDKVLLIPNGVDTQAFGGATPLIGESGAPVTIGMAARFSATKRFDLMIDTLRTLRAAQPDRRWRMTLAGSGENWDAVRREAERIVPGADLTFEGMLSGRALADWYRGLDVYCHASDGETLSVSVLQAMASALPIVASDVEGISNLLGGQPPVGRLVEAQSADAFARAIVGLVGDASAAQDMAQRARSTAEDAFSSTVMFASYRRLVAELIAHRSPQS